MDEKTIVVGKLKSNSLVKILLMAGAGLCVLALLYCWIRYSTGEYYKSFGFGYGTRVPYNDPDYGMSYLELLERSLDFNREICVGILFYLGILSLVLGVFFNFMMSKCAVTVTDKRVIGKANFGKRVDLPLNQISAVGQGMFSSIAIATSSGRIHFWFLENRDDVFDGLSDLIKNFQIQKTDFVNAETTVIQQTSNADELKKYKELLDAGILTQDEFDAKKKELLGI